MQTIFLKWDYLSPFSFVNSLRVSISEKERRLEVTNSSLKEQLQELQEKSGIAQSCLSQRICALNHELAAFKSELVKYATEKERMKTDMEIFKGNFKYYTVVQVNLTNW